MLSFFSKRSKSLYGVLIVENARLAIAVGDAEERADNKRRGVNLVSKRLIVRPPFFRKFTMEKISRRLT
jgi:hypothetical protein